jgi:hypothetical protein
MRSVFLQNAIWLALALALTVSSNVHAESTPEQKSTDIAARSSTDWIHWSSLFSFAGQRNAHERFVVHVAANRIRLEGVIQKGSAKRLRDILATAPSNEWLLSVNTTGGDAESAIEIANLVADFSVHVEVTGYCLSSCANYIFWAGKKRAIAFGVLGFHGDVGGCAAAKGGFAEWHAARPDDVRTRLVENGKRIAALENQLYTRLGLDSSFNRIACTPTKGDDLSMTAYDIVFPSKTTIESLYKLPLSGEQLPVAIAVLEALSNRKALIKK